MNRFAIVDVRVYAFSVPGSGRDYHDREREHWLIDSVIATATSGYADYRASRKSWGIAALGSILVEIETASGAIGIATGFGGEPACYLIEQDFRRFIVGTDCRDTARLWDQMFCASFPYGRKGLALAAISAVDLAVWDAQGVVRGEPVYRMIGGETKPEIPLYRAGPRTDLAKEMGFWGGKVPLPYGPAEGPAGLQRNREFLARHRDAAGPDFPS